MSLLNDAERVRVATELREHKEAIERIADEIILNITGRKEKLIALGQLMASKPHLFTADDFADLNAVKGILLAKTAQVYRIITDS